MYYLSHFFFLSTLIEQEFNTVEQSLTYVLIIRRNSNCVYLKKNHKNKPDFTLFSIS